MYGCAQRAVLSEARGEELDPMVLEFLPACWEPNSGPSASAPKPLSHLFSPKSVKVFLCLFFVFKFSCLVSLESIRLHQNILGENSQKVVK